MNLGLQPKSDFSSIFMSSVTEWNHLIKMGILRGGCHTPREGTLVTEKANNRIYWSRPYLLSFLDCYFLYLTQYPRQDGMCTWIGQ